MLIAMSADIAERVAAVATAASKDKARPILTGMQIEVAAQAEATPASVTFVCTDSYRLIAYTIDNAELPELAAIGEIEAGSVLVEAAAFAKALRESTRAVRKANGKRGDRAKVIVDVTVDRLSKSGGVAEPGTVTVYTMDAAQQLVAQVSIERIDGAFPRWASLMPEHRTEGKAPVAVGLNPGYLADMGKAAVAGFGGTAKPNGRLPVRIQFADDDFKPVLLTTGRANDGWRGLLMPVRL